MCETVAALVREGVDPNSKKKKRIEKILPPLNALIKHWAAAAGRRTDPQTDSSPRTEARPGCLRQLNINGFGIVDDDFVRAMPVAMAATSLL